MKKKLMGAIAIVAIAAMTAFNLNISVKNSLSTISMDNIEALASGEGEGYSCSVSVNCAGGATISCTGVSSCTYESDGAFNRGWVKCDGRTTSCS